MRLWQGARLLSIRSSKRTSTCPVPPPADLGQSFEILEKALKGTPSSLIRKPDSIYDPYVHVREVSSPPLTPLPPEERIRATTIPPKPRVWERLVEEYRKNYCPRISPPLVLPSSPTEAEKYSYVQMKRPFLLGCEIFALLCLAFGAWNFVRVSPVYLWCSAYIFLGHSYLLLSVIISIIGKELNLATHKIVLQDHPLAEGHAPSVDVYLPVCKEPLELLENTWKDVAKLQYPAGKMSIFVLDDGADEAVEAMAKQYHFNYIRRPNSPELKKAGNLRHAFAQTSGDYFAVFDADFCPRADFLRETIPYLIAEPQTAILQTPQFFRSTADKSWVEQGAGASQEYIHRIMQTCRETLSGAMCVGSNAVYRRTALSPIGGTFPAASSEDIQTGFYAVDQGWTLKYLPLVLAWGSCPKTPEAFFNQQMRWGDGTLALCLRREFWRSSLTKRQKMCYMIGFMFYLTTAIQPFLSPVPAPLVLWANPESFKFYYLFFAFPSILLDTVAMKMWARGRYTLSVQYAKLV